MHQFCLITNFVCCRLRKNTSPFVKSLLKPFAEGHGAKAPGRRVGSAAGHLVPLWTGAAPCQLRAAVGAERGAGGALFRARPRAARDLDYHTNSVTPLVVPTCPDANLSRDCPLVELPAQPLKVAVSGVGSTVQAPLVATALGLVSVELYLVCLTWARCARQGAEVRKRSPLGEARLYLT